MYAGSLFDIFTVSLYNILQYQVSVQYYSIFEKCTIRENILQLRPRSVINECICLIVSSDILTFIFPAVRLLPSWWYKRGWNWLWQYDLHLGAFRLDCGWPCSNHRKTCERDEADRASWIVAAGEEVSRGRMIDFCPARYSSSSFSPQLPLWLNAFLVFTSLPWGHAFSYVLVLAPSYACTCVYGTFTAESPVFV